jgi:hypothetical protein
MMDRIEIEAKRSKHKAIQGNAQKKKKRSKAKQSKSTGQQERHGVVVYSLFPFDPHSIDQLPCMGRACLGFEPQASTASPSIRPCRPSK